MRLNGWQRIGIVLSVVWILGAGIYQRSSDIKKAQDFASFSYRVCADATGLNRNLILSDCLKQSQKDYEIWIKPSWANVAAISLVPIPIFWLIAYGLIKIYRWVKVGFKQ